MIKGRCNTCKYFERLCIKKEKIYEATRYGLCKKKKRVFGNEYYCGNYKETKE